MFARVVALVVGALVGAAFSSPVFADPAVADRVYAAAKGDFDGDGVIDSLVQPQSAENEVQIQLGVRGSQTTRPGQRFAANFLGLSWDLPGAQANVGDFDGDGHADVFLQSRSIDGEHSVVLSDSRGLIVNITQRFDSSYLGLPWAADQSRAVVGDFDGDGRSDVLLQPEGTDTAATIVLNGGNGSLEIGAQQWRNGFLGRTWNARAVRLYAADFDGDGQSDLLLQVLDKSIKGRPRFESAYALALAGPGGVFSALHDSWGEDRFGAEWSPETHDLVVRDVDGDGIADIWLVAKSGGGSHYLVMGRPGAKFDGVAARWSGGDAPETTLASARNAESATTVAGIGGSRLDPQTGFGDGGIEMLSMVVGGGEIEIKSGNDNRLPNSSYVPGLTPGSFGVDQGGAANYTIPLNTPPGINGMQPNLALSYSSNRGNGLAGMGWGLSGLSNITRCEKNLTQDGTVAPVEYSANAKYCLDGQRLRLITGTYGGHGATYGTEIEGFSRITSYTSGGNGSAVTGGPQYFTVELRDGRVLHYGFNDDSRVEAQGKTVARVWALSRMSDRFGNRVNYGYAEDNANGEHRPTQVTWTERTGQAPIYSAQLVYEGRPAGDVVVGYENGSKYSSTQRLKRIDIKHGANTIREYRLEYDTSATSATQRSRLLEVIECAGGSCLPPHTFDWQNGTKGWDSATNSGASVSTFNYEAPNTLVMDVTGDGREDLVAPRNGTWWIAKSNGNNSFEAFVNTSRTYYSTYYQFALSIDYNGDGKRDLIVPNATVWQVLLASATGGFDAPINTSITSTTSNRGRSYIADVTGDGLEDFMWANGAAVRVAKRNTANTFDASSDWTAGSSLIFTSSPFGTQAGWSRNEIRVIDLDGDARTDILIKGYEDMCGGEPVGCQNPPPDWVPFTSTGSSFVQQENLYDPDAEPLLVDINGDGLTDFMFTRDGTWRFRLNRGGIFDTEINTGISGSTTEGALATDWDGDGYTDILRQIGSNWWVMRSTGAGFASAVDTGLAHSGVNLRLVDLDGDGLSDILNNAGTTNAPWMVSYHFGPTPDLAVAFHDSANNTWEPSYTTLVDTTVYTKGSGAVFPIRDYQGGMTVVGSQTAPNGIGGSYTVDYGYSAARVHAQGRGFLGFGLVKATDSRNGVYTETTFAQDFPRTGMVLDSKTKQSDGTLIGWSWNTLAHATLGSGYDTRHFPYASAQDSRRYEVAGALKGTAIVSRRQDNSYDAFGNLDLAVTSSGAGTGTNQFIVTVNPVLSNYTGSTWCLGMPSSIATTSQIVGGASATRTVTFAHQSTTCRVTTETLPGDPAFPSPNLEVTKNFGYDAYGNVNALSLSGPAVTTRSVATDYSATNGYYPGSVTNAAGQVSSMTWNYSFGKPATATDANALTGAFAYDAFGRDYTVTRPNGVISRSSLSWWMDCDDRTECIQQDAELRDPTTGAYTTHAKAVLDSFGRQRFTDRWLMAGQEWARQELEYDAFGRVQTETVPHFLSGPVFSTVRSFDLLGRVLTETRPASEAAPTGAMSSFAYEGFLTRVTDPNGKVTERTVNARGEVVQMKDALNGVTAYLYEPFGGLTRTTDPLGNQVNMGYDNRGNKRTMSDPDMGAWSYAYNAYGELVTQVDAKAQTTSFTYDPLGRLKTRIQPEGTHTWYYDTAPGKGIGKPHYVTSSNDGYQDTYSYDSLGRVAQVRGALDSGMQDLDFTYDAFSRPATLTYPESTGGPSNRFAVAYEYDAAGALFKVKDANAPTTVFWTNNAITALGAVAQETLGNGVVANNGIDRSTGMIASIQSGIGGGTGLQNLTYKWDEPGRLGQLSDRKDIARGLTEAFVYDDLYRVTAATVNGATSTAVSYNAIGNILTKDGTSFTYNASGPSSVRPHAVTSTAGPVAGSYTYDANGNMTTKAGETLGWTSYNYLASVTKSGESSTFSYAPDRKRYRQVSTFAGVTETTHYLVGGLVEKVAKSTGVTEWRHLVHAGGRVVAQHTRKSTGSLETRYLLRDHLGSVQTVTDESGAALAVLSFDAFGARRNATTWSGWMAWPGSSGAINAARATTPHGYTGHEMLDAVGLVHMNGRVYDPFLGRMISADPTVPEPFNGQAFNRYSYVLNNPLSFTDPSGFTPLAGARGTPHEDGAGGNDFGMLMPNSGCTGSSATGCAGSSTARPETWCSGDGECFTISNGTIVAATWADSSDAAPAAGAPSGGASTNDGDSGARPACNSMNGEIACLDPVAINGTAPRVVEDYATMVAILGLSGRGLVWPTQHPGKINSRYGYRQRWNPAAAGGGQWEWLLHLGWDLLAYFGETVYLTEDAVFWGYYTVEGERGHDAGVAYFYVPSGGYAIEYVHIQATRGLTVGMTYFAGFPVGISNSSGTDVAHLHYGVILNPTMMPNGYLNGYRVNPIYQLGPLVGVPPSVCSGC